MGFLFLTYDGLPVKSGGAHSIRGKNLKLNWQKANNFIKNISASYLNAQYVLKLYLGCEEVRKYVEIFKLKFGLYPKEKMASTYEKFYEWDITEDKVNEVIQILDEIKPQPKHWIEPIRFEATSQFYLSNLDKKISLDGQSLDYNIDDGYGHYTSLSNFMITVTEKVLLSIWLVIPFRTIDAELKSYVNKLVEFAPVKLSDKHWKIWNYTNTQKLIGKKIDFHLLV